MNDQTKQEIAIETLNHDGEILRVHFATSDEDFIGSIRYHYNRCPLAQCVQRTIPEAIGVSLNSAYIEFFYDGGIYSCYGLPAKVREYIYACDEKPEPPEHIEFSIDFTRE